MSQLFIIICITLILSLSLKSKLDLEGFKDFMLPFNNPLSNAFFKASKDTVKVSRDKHTVNLSSYLPDNVLCTEKNIESKLLEQLDVHKIDLAVVSGEALYNAIYGLKQYEGLKYKNIRFVTVLDRSKMVLLCPNKFNFVDLIDIKNSQFVININVGPRFSVHHNCAFNIFNYMGLGSYVKFNHISNMKLLESYGKNVDMVFRITEHPDKLINKLSEKVISHLLSIKSVNTGHLYNKLTDNERDFYSTFPMFHRDLHDMKRIIPKMYPHLTQPNNEHVLYIPTVSVSQILMTHNKLKTQVIFDLLKKRDVPITDKIIHIPVKYSKGTKKYLKFIGHNPTNSQCIHYKEGYCPH